MSIRKQNTRREKLSCSKIVARAMALIDRDGAEALTMRALASQLGIEPMSLYSHFTSKQDLVAEVVAALLLEIKLPALTLPPRKRLVALSHELRRLGHRHPNAFPLVILFPQRLDVALQITESALASYLEAGLSNSAAVQAQRTLLGFVRGYTMWEIGGFAIGCRPGPGQPPRERVIGDLKALGAARFPCVTRLAEQLTRYSPDAEFARSIDLILDATLLSAQLPPRTARSRRPRVLSAASR